MTRYIIEGVWTGYVSRQQRVVHRTVHDGAEKKLRAWAENAGSISYTDGTRLILSVRDCKPRERVEQIHGYTSLIKDCAYYDVSSVDDLIAAKNAARSKVA
jgi:hypothetical protein